MKDYYDVAIVGTGPAGLSAAVNVRARGKTALLIGGEAKHSPLFRAERIDNYLGMNGLTGAEYLNAATAHALSSGAELQAGRVLSIVASGGQFFLSIAAEVVTAGAVVLAGGVVRDVKIAGEAELLGKGVSYCATCDGMLYRGKPVAVLGYSADAAEEANHLKRIGCTVMFFSPKSPVGLDKDIPYTPLMRPEITGDAAVSGLKNGGATYPFSAVFILRPAIAPTDLLPGLALENGYIKVSRQMETNIPGVFAAGDCTGLPLQISKAAGEGLIAGQAAAEYVNQKGA